MFIKRRGSKKQNVVEANNCPHKGAHPDTSTGAPAVPARSTSLGRVVLEHSGDFPPAILLRTRTVRGPVLAVWRCAPHKVTEIPGVAIAERMLQTPVNVRLNLTSVRIGSA